MYLGRFTQSRLSILDPFTQSRLSILVGVAGFEPAISRPPGVRDTMLRHTPSFLHLHLIIWLLCRVRDHRNKLLALLFVLNLADAVLTAVAMQLPGFTELNPIMSFFLDLGLGYFFLFKIGVICACIAGFIHVWDRSPSAKKVAWFANILYMLIVLWNGAMIGLSWYMGAN